MNTCEDFENAIKSDPGDFHRRLIFADWLDEQGELEEANTVRTEAGTVMHKALGKIQETSEGVYHRIRIVAEMKRIKYVPPQYENDYDGEAWHQHLERTIFLYQAQAGFAVSRLLTIYESFPDHKTWKEHHYNLVLLWIEHEEKRKRKNYGAEKPTSNRKGYKKINIAEITVGERHRKELGDIKALADSLEKIGLINPITIDLVGTTLLCGYRRLQAAKLLGWKTIDAKFVNSAELGSRLRINLEIERDENEMRKEFTVSERVAIAQAIEEKIGKRRGQRTDKLSQKIGEVVPAPGQKTKELAGEAAGFGNEETYRQAEKVTANAVPEIVEAMDNEEVSISDAAKVADKPTKVQEGALKAKREKKSKTLAAAAEQIEEAAETETPEEKNTMSASSWLGALRDCHFQLSQLLSTAKKLQRAKQSERKAKSLLEMADSLRHYAGRIEQWIAKEMDNDK